MKIHGFLKFLPKNPAAAAMVLLKISRAATRDRGGGSAVMDISDLFYMKIMKYTRFNVLARNGVPLRLAIDG